MLEKLQDYLLNEYPIAIKMKALFTLKSLKTEESIRLLCSAFNNQSVLFKHELAYVLGQIRDDTTIKTLINVLENESEDEIVRHEAAEALANFNHSNKFGIIKLFSRYLNHSSIPLRETCYISLQKLSSDTIKESRFNSFDPATSSNIRKTFKEIEEMFLNEETDLFMRYEILFYLRDINTEESVNLLCRGMRTGSELMKHEIAFVFGQLAAQEPQNVHLATETMIYHLRNRDNHPMVRHECAETLGGIGCDQSIEALKEFVDDDCEVVKESCLVALDIFDYKVSKDLEYVY